MANALKRGPTSAEQSPWSTDGARVGGGLEHSGLERLGQRCNFHGDNIFARLNGVQHMRREGLIRADNQQGVAATLLKRALHTDDVKEVVTEHLHDHPNDSRAVYIMDKQHVPFRHDFDLELVNFDDPRLLLVLEIPVTG